MSVNVILTFETIGKYGDTQEFFDTKLAINKNEKSADSFINNKLFKRIIKVCEQFGRCTDELTNISIASTDWDLFERVTGLDCLKKLGHNSKWYFGNGREDLDSWEKQLMLDYGFGTAVDMSWMYRGEAGRKEHMDRFMVQVEQYANR